MLGKSLLPLLLVILIGAAGYFVYVLHTRYVPCVTPIQYSLVAYDERFGIPKTEIEKDITEAARVWNDALGKEVLVESGGKKPALPISFVYGSVQNSEDTIDSINADIDALKIEQTKAANRYAASKSPEDLKAYYDIKNKISADLAKGSVLPSGSEIQEGRYVSDDQGTRIFIYGFKTHTELMRVLAHEFGHALGLGHVENADSIMYASNNSMSLELSSEDRAELARACSGK